MNEAEALFKTFRAYRYGEVIAEGPTPISDEIREQATEIHWDVELNQSS